jgi:hypothetical protein
VITLDRYYAALVRSLLDRKLLSAVREPREAEPHTCQECNDAKIPLFSSRVCRRGCDTTRRDATRHCPVCGYLALLVTRDFLQPDLVRFVCARRDCVATELSASAVLESEATP